MALADAKKEEEKPDNEECAKTKKVITIQNTKFQQWAFLFSTESVSVDPLNLEKTQFLHYFDYLKQDSYERQKFESI